jgi:hypothetical protein
MDLVALLGRIGANTALHLARITGLPVADVYAELVALEAQGRARVMVDYVAGRRIAKWEAMVPDHELPSAMRDGALEVFG